MTPEEIAWAAGLFEGEGCFTGASRGRFCMKMSMCDEEVIRRFHRTVGMGGVSGPHKPTGLGTLMHWEWRSERFEHMQAIVAMFWPWLSTRRRNRAAEVLMNASHRVPLTSQMFGKHVAELTPWQERVYRAAMTQRWRDRAKTKGGV